ncbi:MAG: hypothetical protein Q7R56_02230 [Nanoarchaeota archaeon]|nr:hypothetical protein [Nanoarchaeota archaeon]
MTRYKVIKEVEYGQEITRIVPENVPHDSDNYSSSSEEPGCWATGCFATLFIGLIGVVGCAVYHKDSKKFYGSFENSFENTKDAFEETGSFLHFLLKKSLTEKVEEKSEPR